MIGPRWIKSSASGSGADAGCVEILNAPDAVFVRDSKNRLEALSFRRDGWITFLAAVKDHNVTGLLGS